MLGGIDGKTTEFFCCSGAIWAKKLGALVWTVGFKFKGCWNWTGGLRGWLAKLTSCCPNTPLWASSSLFRWMKRWGCGIPLLPFWCKPNLCWCCCTSLRMWPCCWGDNWGEAELSNWPANWKKCVSVYLKWIYHGAGC